MRVLVAMSGGVDSAVAALLLKEQGHEVAGATFELFDGCAESNVQDAKAVCDRLGIEHMVFDYRQRFSKLVLDYFVASYAAGETPNPCIACNRGIKFGEFAQDAVARGFERISTGHYAGVRLDDKTGRYGLYCSAQRRKDQSYVLYHLSQQQLAMLLLPVEQYDKDTVREFASRAGLPVQSKSDSQDICFVPDGDYVSFIERYAGIVPREGDYIDDDGQILGRHKGVLHYTIGQRKGLGISLGAPRFVSRIDPAANLVTLSDERAVFSDRLYARELSLIAVDRLDEPLACEVKIRYAHTPAPAVVYPMGDGYVQVVFETPQRAAAKGQAAVFYKADQVFGGATICEKI